LYWAPVTVNGVAASVCAMLLRRRPTRWRASKLLPMASVVSTMEMTLILELADKAGSEPRPSTSLTLAFVIASV
jgi:hypothetical protein